MPSLIDLGYAQGVRQRRRELAALANRKPFLVRLWRALWAL